MATAVENLITKVNINGTWYNLTYNSTTGKFEKSITAPNTTSFNLPGGYYPVTVEVTDEAGNKTTVDDTHATLGSACRLFVKETTAPTITITSPSDGSTVGTNTPSIAIQLREEIDGSGVNIDTFTLQIDGGAALGSTAEGMTVTPVGNGYDVTYTPPSGLTDGAHTVYVNVSDNDGNAAMQKSVSFTIDTAPPELSITSPTNGIATNQTTIAVVGTTNDIYSSPVTVTITVNGVDQGAVTINVDGSFSHDINLTEGANTIIITATDSIGKYSQVTRNVTLDTVPPTISNVEVAPDTVNVGESLTVKVTVTDS